MPGEPPQQPRPEERKGLATAGVIFASVGLLLAGALAIAILLPSLTHGRVLAKRAQCAANLLSLSKSLRSYLDDQDEYPVELDTALKKFPLPPKTLHCPAAQKGRACDYFYSQPRATAPGGALMACDLAGNHPDVRNVLYTSGTVDTIWGEEAFQKLMAKPENADFAAKLRQTEGGSDK